VVLDLMEATMANVVVNGAAVIPAEAATLDGFRHWARSDSFPERGRFDFLGGDVWADLVPEQPFTHNCVRTAVTTALDTLADALELGHYFSAGMRLTHRAAALSVMPDAVFISYEARSTGRLQYVPTGDGDYDEFVGSPDMVLEVVSNSSLRRDTDELIGFYFRAGIPEYWLIDARGETAEFDIFRAGPDGYVRTRRQSGGWLESQVFGRSFRFTQTTNPRGNPRYEVEVRQ
jgi:Uma2 family endonuclease